MSATDETLAAQAARLGDTEAFAELVRRHQGKILLLQRRLTREPALAEDLSQETFLRAWQKLSTFSGTGSFAGWLASLSYNVFLQDRRSRKRQRAEIALDDVAPAGLIDSGDGAADGSVLADLERLLSALDREDQIIMVLFYAHGLSATELGRVVRMPSGTVKARIHRAKARLRERIASGMPPEPDSEARTRQGSGSSEADRRATGRQTTQLSMTTELTGVPGT